MEDEKKEEEKKSPLSEAEEKKGLDLRHRLFLSFMTLVLLTSLLWLSDEMLGIKESGLILVPASFIAAAGIYVFVLRPLSAALDELNTVTKNVLEKKDFSQKLSERVEKLLGSVVTNFNVLMNHAEELYTRYRELKEKEVSRADQLYAANVALREYSELVAERNRALEETKIKLEEANRIKSAFLSSVSHEIRTPLTAILGYADILRSVLSDRLPEKMRKNLDNIRSNARALMALINDILDLSRIEAGKMAVTVNRFPLMNIVEACTSEIEVLLRGRPIEFLTDIEGKGYFLETDEGKLRQILTNLLSNAAKFTDEGHVMLRVKPDGDNMVFEVEDTGIGLTEEQMSFIFDDFRQVEMADNRGRYGGTGLGLSISQRLIDMLGGTISVRSELGKGSVFTVSIPRKYSPKVEETKEGKERMEAIEAYEAEKVEDEEVDWT